MTPTYAPDPWAELREAVAVIAKDRELDRRCRDWLRWLADDPARFSEWFGKLSARTDESVPAARAAAAPAGEDRE